MDDVVQQLARELAGAIAAAVADSARVDACRAKATEAGFELRVTLEAVAGFTERATGAPAIRIATPARVLPPKRYFNLNATDRRFLRSLRIAPDGTTDAVE